MTDMSSFMLCWADRIRSHAVPRSAPSRESRAFFVSPKRLSTLIFQRAPNPQLRTFSTYIYLDTYLLPHHKKMAVKEITDLNEFQVIINSGKPAIFDFWAEWCGPCKAISPIFENFAASEEFTGVGFYKVDVDAAEQIAQEVGIRAMPTFMLFKAGEKVSDLTGAHPNKLDELVRFAVSLV
ncbi:hypothetical protein VTN00DRAFT_4669 [Thermoascus crustaceus]|uniref:uncharacterized protein n=1 Tax=Thermoascus crustaceus TaxID=5088 RepID=UPI0037426F2E